MTCRRRGRGPVPAALLSGVLLVAACSRGPSKPPAPALAHEALATFRADLARLLAEQPRAPAGSAIERARLGELATHGRALLRRTRERVSPIAPELLATFLPPVEASAAAPPPRARRLTFLGRDYSIASRELARPDGTVWVEVIDTAGSPELLAAFEVERAAADGSRFRALEIDHFPAVQTTAAASATRPGQVAETLQVLVADRLLVAARATSGVDPASLAAALAPVDLEELATLVASRSDDAPGQPAQDLTERTHDG